MAVEALTDAARRRQPAAARAPEHHHGAPEPAAVHRDLDPERIAERHREKEVARARLARLAAEAPRRAGRQSRPRVRRFNGTPGNAASFDALHELLEAQAYRLAYWRTASHEINYRRFFDVNTLAGLRVEDPEVFAATHQLLAQLMRDGTRPRRPHRSPGRTVRSGAVLRDAAGSRRPAWDVDRPRRARPRRWRPRPRPLYVVAEKILSGGERLPSRLGRPRHHRLQLSQRAQRPLRRRRAGAARRAASTRSSPAASEPFDDVRVHEQAADHGHRDGERADRARAHARPHRARATAGRATSRSTACATCITEVVACFPVYRTYVDEHGWTPEDRAVIERAIARARRRNPAMESSLFDFFREVVLPRDPDERQRTAGRERRGRVPAGRRGRSARARLRFAMKLQQYTGPVQAKGLEDTAFYRYNVLLSLNEVGGDPVAVRPVGRGVPRRQSRAGPRTGRSRCSPRPRTTRSSARTCGRASTCSRRCRTSGAARSSRWMRINRPHRTLVDGEPAPDRNDEYRFYQALVGVWPADLPDDTAAPPTHRSGMRDYMIKAVREAKVHTSWLNPNQRVRGRARALRRARRSPGRAGRRFLRGVPARSSAGSPRSGMINSLAQVVAEARVARRARLLSGHRAVGSQPRRSRQPAAGRFRRIRARLLDDVDGVLAQRSGGPRAGALAEMLRELDGRAHQAAHHRRRAAPASRACPTCSWPARTCRSPPRSPCRPTRSRSRGWPDAEGESAGRALRGPASLRRGRGAAIIRFRSAASAGRPHGCCCPRACGERTFRHEITGAEIRPTRGADSAWIFLGEAFQTVPVAILRAI